MSASAERGWHDRALAAVRLLASALLLASTASVSVHATASQRQQALLQITQGSTSLLRGSYAEAESLLGDALESGALDYLERAAALKNRGVARWRLQRWRAAIADFNAAVKITPEDPTLYNNRGNVLVSLGLNEEAIKDFDRSILLSPHYAEAFNNRGNAHFKAGNYGAAFGDFSKAIELRPHDAVPFNGRGKTQLLLGRPFGALRDLKRATTLNAAYTIAHANRAKALMALRRYETAIEEYALAIRLQPKSGPTYRERAQAYARSGNPGAALEDMTAAIALDPSSPTAFAERSAVYDALGKEEEARADLREALALDPNSVAALAYLARSLSQAGAPAAALPTINAALDTDPDSALALRVRGEIREALKQPKLAEADYRKALLYEPFQPESRLALRRIAEANDTFQATAVAAPLKGWTVSLSPTNRYVVENAKYPALRFTLEMYGQGEPELLDWKLLKGPLRRTGMLSYYAGSSPDGKRLEYAALIDTQGKKLVGIEPVRWGGREAEWTWDNVAVVVEDPEGIPNRLELKRAPPPASMAKRRATSQGRARRAAGSESGGFLPRLMR